MISDNSLSRVSDHSFGKSFFFFLFMDWPFSDILPTVFLSVLDFWTLCFMLSQCLISQRHRCRYTELEGIKKHKTQLSLSRTSLCFMLYLRFLLFLMGTREQSSWEMDGIYESCS